MDTENGNGPHYFKLNTRTKMPAVGLGTWKASACVVGEDVITAVKAGYRHIDCAKVYDNEKEWENVTRREMRTKPFVRTLEFLWQEGHTANATPEEAEKEFDNEDGQREHLWQTSWAISTHFVSGIIMTHGDDAGLMLPTKLTPIQLSSYFLICMKDDSIEGIYDTLTKYGMSGQRI